MTATRCSSGLRHWFTVYGWVSVRAPKCQRCGAPNPRITPEQVEQYEGLMQHLHENARAAEREAWTR